MCRYRSADSIQPCRVVLVVINLLLAELHVQCLKIFMQDFQECKACVKVGLFFCFLFFGSMDTKMSTMSPFGGEAGSGEFSGGLQFEDAVPVLLEGVSALLPGFPITMHSTLVNKLLQTVQVFFIILLSG